MFDSTSSPRRRSTTHGACRLRHGVTVLVLLLAASACGDDTAEGAADETASDGEPAEESAETGEEPEDAPPESAEEHDDDADAGTSNERVLPAEFPAAFPLPDEYMIVRMDVGEYEEVGVAMALNIAIDGTVEDWSAFYDEALRAEFNDVQVRDDIQDDPWHFQGHGFEFGTLYVSNNLGIPDMDGNDSSHLPVMLTISFDERRAN